MLSNISLCSKSSCFLPRAQTLNTKPLSSQRTSPNSEPPRGNTASLTAPQNSAEETRTVYSTAASHDGKWLALSSANQIQLWSRAPASQYTLKSHSDWISSIAFSEDNQWLASGSYNGTIHLQQIKNNQPAKLHHKLSCGEMSISSMAFLQNGQVTQLAVGTIDGKISIWSLNNLSKPEFVKPLSVPGPIYQLAFSGDGQWLASSSDNFINVNVYDPVGNNVIDKFELTDENKKFFDATCVTFSRDNLWLASGSTDGVIRLWSLANQTTKPSLRYTFEEHTAAINCIAFSEDSKQLASTSVDNTFGIRSLDSEQSPAVLQTCSEDLLSIIWQPKLSQNPLLLTRGLNRAINLRQVETHGLSLHWTSH
ncbi:WD40 repeat domain-containing protein [Mycoavidus cysteinexigens]|nr:hypothetical protein [Mycoavidus cysteinexigens]